MSSLSYAAQAIPVGLRRITQVIDVAAVFQLASDGVISNFSFNKIFFEAKNYSYPFHIDFLIVVGENGMTTTATDGNFANTIQADLDTALNKSYAAFKVGSIKGIFKSCLPRNAADGYEIFHGNTVVDLMPWMNRIKQNYLANPAAPLEVFLLAVTTGNHNGDSVGLFYHHAYGYKVKPTKFKWT